MADIDPKLSKFERSPDGYVIIGGQEVAHTVQCCHCSVHFISQKGSGKVRGFCVRCNARTCGHPRCNACVPYEKQMEMQEGTARSLFLPGQR